MAVAFTTFAPRSNSSGHAPGAWLPSSPSMAYRIFYTLVLDEARRYASALVGRGTLKKCVNSQAVYPLSEQDGLEAQERRYTAHEEGKH